jgi:hypothetical protein
MSTLNEYWTFLSSSDYEKRFVKSFSRERKFSGGAIEFHVVLHLSLQECINAEIINFISKLIRVIRRPVQTCINACAKIDTKVHDVMVADALSLSLSLSL